MHPTVWGDSLEGQPLCGHAGFAAAEENVGAAEAWDTFLTYLVFSHFFGPS